MPHIPDEASVPDLIERLRAQLDDDERWARAACQAYPYAIGNPALPPRGVHWTWVAGEDWEPVRPDPVIDEFVAPPGETCNLATVEQWPVTTWGIPDAPERRMPRTYANGIVEMDASAAGHIVRWDPARVLALTAALREIIDSYSWEGQETRAIIALAGALLHDSPEGTRAL